MSKIYYTSDLHLFHTGLANSFRGFAKYGVESVDKMNEHIIQSISEVVQPDDTLFILGDILVPNNRHHNECIGLLKAIRCCKYVVKGNHDRPEFLEYLENNNAITGWSHTDYTKDRVFDIDVIIALHHFPIIDYHHANRANFCFHGHSHGNLKIKHPDLFDVGMDNWDFKPVTAEQVLSRYYGDHPNPYIGMIDSQRRFVQLITDAHKATGGAY